ncbi:type IX secretion system membrane protein PorP/SprF [Bacteroidota bacterium]
MVKRIIISILLILVFGRVFGQHPPIHSLYMFDPILINPAFTGSAVQLSATFLHRNQWVNFPGAPSTQSMSLHSGFLQSRVGVGLYMTRDNIGIHSDYSMFGTYAYKIKSKRGVFSMGLQGGFHHLSSDFNLLNIRNLNDPNLGGVINKLNPNVGVGFLYSEKKFFAGFSIPYLLENKLYDIESVLSEAKQSRLYYLHGGITLEPNSNLTVKPSVQFRLQHGSPFSFDLNCTFIYKDRIGLGGSYRVYDAMIFLFELKVLENFHIGYAYDYTTSEINKFSNGSHEIMLNYRVKLGKLHKGLQCPSYF